MESQEKSNSNVTVAIMLRVGPWMLNNQGLWHLVKVYGASGKYSWLDWRPVSIWPRWNFLLKLWSN